MPHLANLLVLYTYTYRLHAHTLSTHCRGTCRGEVWPEAALQEPPGEVYPEEPLLPGHGCLKELTVMSLKDPAVDPAVYW
jgi:hypothetical protein